MALREVMKIDTSTTAQVKLNDYHESSTTKDKDVEILDGTRSLLQDSEKFELFKQCVFNSSEPVKRKNVETEESDCKKIKQSEENTNDISLKTQPSLI